MASIFGVGGSAAECLGSRFEPFNPRLRLTIKVNGMGDDMARTRISGVAVAGVIVCLLASSAQAGGFFDSLFGGFAGSQGRAPAYTYADPNADLAMRGTAPGVRSESSGYSGGGKAFCVRLCDGRYYPITSGSANSTPVQMCSAMCPAAKTKVFHGGEIASATDAGGQHYIKLDQAFAYRKSVVPGCSCNGKDAFGLVTVDVASDPTLRAGDKIVTEEGVKAVGRKGADFVPASRVSVRERVSDLSMPERQ
jgi:uncharacterized protein DUF2865